MGVAAISNIGMATAFAAGVVSFLSPCVLPLVPGYVSFVSGAALGDGGPATRGRLSILALALSFVVGFSTVFIALGASATAISHLLLQYRYEANVAGGAIVMLFGAFMTGLIPMPWLQRDLRFHGAALGGRPTAAYVLGLAFGFGWTPCIGPILATILAVAGSEDTASHGAALLGAYSLGLGAPFVLAAVAMGPFLSAARRCRSQFGRLEKLVGGLLVLTGVAFLTGGLQAASGWLINAFPTLGQLG